MKASISEAIYTYDALQKRKPFLDQMMEGLEEFQVATAMRLFPDVFEPLFVSRGAYEPQDVINILRSKITMTHDEEVVYNFLKRFISECTPTGI